MAKATGRETAAQGAPRSLAHLPFFAVSAGAVVYILFLYGAYSNAELRALGFSDKQTIENLSFIVFGILGLLTMYFYGRSAPPAELEAKAAASQTSAARGAVPAPAPAPGVRPLEDPASRPGAPPSLDIARVQPDGLQGGWNRFKFPAERTGGLYVDTDIVVDEKERSILRMREEVARVCVRCDLIDYCHSHVATLVTRQDMLANHECVAGLKQIARDKLETRKAAQAAAARAPVAPATPRVAKASASPRKRTRPVKRGSSKEKGEAVPIAPTPSPKANEPGPAPSPDPEAPSSPSSPAESKPAEGSSN